tara:strand:+ start:14008 stop:15393 length:1386 start_codon:yes stop_codon:yes gene_type:complete
MIDLKKLSRAANAFKANGLITYELERPGDGGMSPGQEDFHRSDHQRRILIGGNQIGKTRALCAESWWHAVGNHPYRDAPEAPNLGWVMTADLKAGWANFSRKMREIEPPGVLSPRCFYDDARGYTRGGSKMIELKSGSLIIGKSGSQDQMALSGATIDWLGIDELPKQAHWGEARSRVAVNSAPVFMCFTPIGRPAEFLRDWVDGNPDTGAPAREDWYLQRVILSAENCPHRDAESIENQIAGYGPWEFAQRVEGAWAGVTTDAWIAFTEENIFDDPPENIEAIGLGWDHGEKPGASVCYLVAWDGMRLWVLDEYKSTERNTPKVEAKDIKAMVERWGINLHQIDEARGDSNSAGRLGLGFSVNELLERGFADALGKTRAPFNIQVPWKGAGSVKARARLLSHSCLDGSFMVSSQCKSLISALRHWRGESASDFKHHFDAVGYIAEVYLTESLQNSGYLII